MDVIFVSHKPKGGLSQAWVMSGTDTISQADGILPYNMQHCWCELKDPTINFPYSSESLFFFLFFHHILRSFPKYTVKFYMKEIFLFEVYYSYLFACVYVCVHMYVQTCIQNLYQTLNSTVDI